LTGEKKGKNPSGRTKVALNAAAKLGRTFQKKRPSWGGKTPIPAPGIRKQETKRKPGNRKKQNPRGKPIENLGKAGQSEKKETCSGRGQKTSSRGGRRHIVEKRRPRWGEGTRGWFASKREEPGKRY